MNPSHNTILITGGASGIGLGLAVALQKAGNRVIVTGRNQKKLDDAARANAGLTGVALDVTKGDEIKKFATKIVADFPALNVVINNAGIMRPENAGEPTDKMLTDAEEMITTNLLGTIRLTAALLPHFKSRPQATVMTVSSGLAFVPLALTPTYCATKAAVHSYSQSLRYQLRNSKVEVLELIPPYVATTLMGDHQAQDPRAMPLGEFIDEVMRLLRDPATSSEINVERVRPLRTAADGGAQKYEQFFRQFNDEMSATSH